MTPDSQQSPEASGFCSQCGTPNPRTAAFCARCGALLPWAATKAEPVAPEVVTPPPEAASVPPPPPMMPPPPPLVAQAPPTPLTMAQPANAPPQSVTPNTPDLAAGVGAFVSNLKADVASKTPQELMRRYAWHLAALAVLLFVVVRFASTLVTLAALGALVSLVVGLKNPEKFRWVFGAHTSKSAVGWTFGALFFVLVTVLPSLDGRQEGAAPVVASGSGVAPVDAPVNAQPVPTGAPVKRVEAQMRADAAKERAARARAKAQQELGEKLAEKKQAERALAERAEEQRAVDEAFEPEITLTPTGVLIKNNSQKKWETCWVYINFHPIWDSGYRHLSFNFAPHESHEIAYSEFRQRSDSGTKIFSESGEKIKKIRFTASIGDTRREYEISGPT